MCVCASYANCTFAPHFSHCSCFSKGADFPLTEYLVQVNTCSTGELGPSALLYFTSTNTIPS